VAEGKFRIVKASFSEDTYKLQSGVCNCEGVNMKDVVYVEAFPTWGIPMHLLCKRLMMNKDGYNKLTSGVVK